jgi:hypothetical protein
MRGPADLVVEGALFIGEYYHSYFDAEVGFGGSSDHRLNGHIRGMHDL